MESNSFELFAGSFVTALQFLIVIAGSFAAIVVCAMAGALFYWSVHRIWTACFAQSEDASRKRDE